MYFEDKRGSQILNGMQIKEDKNILTKHFIIITLNMNKQARQMNGGKKL